MSHFIDARYAGIHLIIDLWEADPEILKNSEVVRAGLISAARRAGATVLSDSFHYFGAECGVTGVVVLAESHISIHTWPEDGYAAVDIFMCGTCDPRCAVEEIVTSLKATKHTTNLFYRGLESKQ